ncbi:MAG TPA: hypothetical protein VGP28_04555 [Methylocella sp.]|jgi:hypothetical protein|nr:hypothetical protein [Methylocella sp.]
MKVPLGARVEPPVKAALAKAAKKDKRPLSVLVEIILTDWLKANGFLK